MPETQFFRTIMTMQELATQPYATDTTISANNNSLGPEIIRHGLSVTAFAMLEQFLIARTDIFMEDISSSPIPYCDLSEKFRELVSKGAILGLSNKINLKNATDRLNFAESEIITLSQFSSNPKLFSGHGFIQKGSNINSETIKSFLKAIGIDDPWGRMKNLCSTIGSSQLSLEVNFRTLSMTRHRSAHNPTGAIASADLINNLHTAKLVAITFSMLLSELRKCYIHSVSAQELAQKISNIALNFCTVVKRDHENWAKMSTNGVRATKIYSSEAAAIAAAHSQKSLRSLLVKDNAGIPLAFYPEPHP